MSSTCWIVYIVLVSVHIGASEEYAKCTVKLDLKDCEEPPYTKTCSRTTVCNKHFNIVYMDHKPFPLFFQPKKVPFSIVLPIKCYNEFNQIP